MSLNRVKCRSRSLLEEENHSECIVFRRPKDVTDGVDCQHVDNVVLCSCTMLFSAFRQDVAHCCLFPFFSFFIWIIKFNIKFEAVASELLDKGSLHILVVIIADALQVFFLFAAGQEIIFFDKCCFDCIIQSCRISLFEPF